MPNYGFATINFSTNKTGTFGLFPHGQLGGETGTGVGVRLFYTNILGRKNALTAHYIYSGEQGQFCEGLYIDPNLLDTGLIWEIQGGYLQTKNRNANINGAIDDDESRLFELKKVDVETSVEWRLETNEIASFAPQFKIVGRLGFSQRDFYACIGVDCSRFPTRDHHHRLVCLRGWAQNSNFIALDFR